MHSTTVWNSGRKRAPLTDAPHQEQVHRTGDDGSALGGALAHEGEQDEEICHVRPDGWASGEVDIIAVDSVVLVGIDAERAGKLDSQLDGGRGAGSQAGKFPADGVANLIIRRGGGEEVCTQGENVGQNNVGGQVERVQVGDLQGVGDSGTRRSQEC